MPRHTPSKPSSPSENRADEPAFLESVTLFVRAWNGSIYVYSQHDNLRNALPGLQREINRASRNWTNRNLYPNWSDTWIVQVRTPWGWQATDPPVTMVSSPKLWPKLLSRYYRHIIPVEQPD
jgi:hypothetical protein